MKKLLLSVRNVKQYFPLPKKRILQRKREFVRANEDISLDIYEGETYGLVGESGCGKSTLGRTVLGLLPPTAGEIFYYDREGKEWELTSLNNKRFRPLRSQLQIVFQDPYSSLNPRMTVGQIIEEGVATHGFYKKGSKEMHAYVLEVMKKCGLQGYMAGRYPHEFSGGQRQRVCIARALAVKPRFVVCDECVSALDVSIQSQIINLLTDLKEQEGLTYLFISHDLSVVRHISDRIGVMYKGRLVEWGSAVAVFDTPSHPYTRTLLAAIPSIEEEGSAEIGEVRLRGEPTLEGCPFFGRCFAAEKECQRTPAPLVEVEKGHFAACRFAQKLFKKG